MRKLFERAREVAEKHQLRVAFVFGLLVDFVASWYSYAFTHDWLVLQASLGFIVPILNFPLILLFVDEKDLIKRIKLTLVMALAMTMGSTLVLLMVKHGIGIGTDVII